MRGGVRGGAARGARRLSAALVAVGRRAEARALTASSAPTAALNSVRCLLGFSVLCSTASTASVEFSRASTAWSCLR
eukprot:6877744-Prymnesium_polylepis.1